MSVSIERVKDFLLKDFISPSREWLQDCVQFYQENNVNCADLLKKTSEFARDQWLLEDISQTVDPARPCLPQNLISQKRVLLDGSYALQINHALDVGTSYFKQLQNIQKATPLDVAEDEQVNTQVEVSGQRTLKFSLTDGKQQISGLEYKPLKNLNVKNIVPGFKILVKGPVECRRGILMLKNENIKELGGHVESIFKDNDQTKIILERLCKPQHMANEDDFVFRGPNSSGNNKNKYSNCNSASNANQRSRPMQRNTNQTFTNEDDIDELMAQLPDDEFMADPFQSESSAKKFKAERAQPPTRCEQFEDIQFDSFAFEVENTDDDEVRIDLLKLNALTSNERTNKIFIAKAKMHSTLGKLKFKNREWWMKCRITDGEGYLDVTMENEIISKLLKEGGYDCHMEVKDDENKEKLTKALVDMKSRMAQTNDHHIVFRENEAFLKDVVKP